MQEDADMIHFAKLFRNDNSSIPVEQFYQHTDHLLGDDRDWKDVLAKSFQLSFAYGSIVANLLSLVAIAASGTTGYTAFSTNLRLICR